jgi:hypothetical protein
MEIYWKSKPYQATIISIGIKVFVLLYIVIAVCECAYTLSFLKHFYIYWSRNWQSRSKRKAWQFGGRGSEECGWWGAGQAPCRWLVYCRGLIIRFPVELMLPNFIRSRKGQTKSAAACKAKFEGDCIRNGEATDDSKAENNRLIDFSYSCARPSCNCI